MEILIGPMITGCAWNRDTEASIREQQLGVLFTITIDKSPTD
jgi:hypothetical protein